MNLLITRLAKFSAAMFDGLLDAPLFLLQFAMSLLGLACWAAISGAIAYAILTPLSGSPTLGLYGGVLWGLATFFRKSLEAVFARGGG